MINSKRKVGIQPNTSKFFIHILVAVCCGLACIFALFCLMAKILCSVDLPVYMTVPMSTIAISVAAFLAAAVFSLLRGEKGLLSGLLFGLGMFAVLWVFALTQGQTSFSQLAAIKLGAMVCSGAIGGLLGVMMHERKRKIR